MMLYTPARSERRHASRADPMLHAFRDRIDAFERGLRRAADTGLSTPAGRRAAFWHFHLVDHAFVRLFWSNLHRVADGVWRANQPAPRHIRRYRAMGIRTILSLRGERPESHRLFEEEACREHGIALVSAKLRARHLAPRERLLELLDLFERLEKPFLMHCKSGSDRAGFAAALYLLHMEAAPVPVALRQLGWKYLHRRSAAAGVLDHMLEAYAAATRRAPVPLRRWIETEYDPAALEAAFHRARGAAG